MVAFVSESLWSRILQSSLKLSEILSTKKRYKKMFLMKYYVKPLGMTKTQGFRQNLYGCNLFLYP